MIKDNIDINVLDNLFRTYGYEVRELSPSLNRVYLLNQGMYHGAEVQIMDGTDPDTILDRFSKLGYHAKLQMFRTIEDAENYLFEGFFNTKTTENDITRRYEQFSSNQVKHYGNEGISYKYITMPYNIYSEDTEYTNTNDIVAAIRNVIDRKGAHLVIVEAAAGFGKTCTAYEVYKSFLNNTKKQKPIFTELSRNRDAKQFKYILWSEIDKEKDTTAKQDLVVYNIKKGKIPLIIDGFDELLSKDIDPGKAGQLNEFEQVETMLSTIGDLLTDESKIILTSRKTAIFAGTEFESWVDSFNGSFDVVRFQLEKPDIKQWLSSERYQNIIDKKIPLQNISNPVLLTYLRNIDKSKFDCLLENPETITDKYFEYLLEREKERQQLTIRWEEQMLIFENLAKSFFDFDITGESRRFIKELIIDYNKPKLLHYKETMPTKQTLDELADTLTNHALLDRIGNKDFITFVNEFILGYLLGKSIQKEDISYLEKFESLPEYLIELAVSSYKYSSQTDKLQLWEKFSTIKNRMSLYLAITTDCSLSGKIIGNFKCETINSFNFENINFSNKDCTFVDVSFVDSVFDNCSFDIEAFINVTFIGCKFINCNILNNSFSNPISIHCYGCDDYDSNFISSLETVNISTSNDYEELNLEMQILSKYFKVDGKSPKMRYISNLKKEFEGQNIDIIFTIFNSLKKKGMILIDGNNSHISKLGINYYNKNTQV